MAETGFDIYGKFYPMVEAFALGDPVLIRELTGLDFPSFAEAYDELTDAVGDSDGEVEIDPVVLVGLVGVSVWHANPTWRRDKVLRYVQHLPIEQIQLVGGEEDDADDPPADTPPAKASGGTPADSSSSAGETANPNGSGGQTSPIGAASA